MKTSREEPRDGSDWLKAERVVGGAATPCPAGRVAVVGVLAGLAGAVVAASSSGLLSRLRDELPTSSIGAALGDVVAVLLAAMLLGFVGLAYLAWVDRARGPERAVREEEQPRQATDWSAWLLPLLFVSVIALGIALGWLFGRAGGSEPPGAGLPLPAPVQPPPRAPAGGDAGGWPVHWLVFAALSSVGVVAAAVLLVRDWRRRRRVQRPTAAEELVVAVDESLDDLEREPDPRLAVIQAYGRMERALALQGAGRRPPETPLEYLARALEAVRVSRSSITRLTSLFQRAKFSRHAIDAAMKREAIDALRDLRAELAGLDVAGAAR